MCGGIDTGGGRRWRGVEVGVLGERVKGGEKEGVPGRGCTRGLRERPLSGSECSGIRQGGGAHKSP